MKRLYRLTKNRGTAAVRSRQLLYSNTNRHKQVQLSYVNNTSLRLFSTEKKNKYEWMDGTVFDDNIKFDKRKLLKKELKRGVGFVGDIRELRETGGKV